MTPRGDRVHALPGRTRFRVPARKRDDGFFSRVAEELDDVDGVRRVEVNAATASVLVIHENALEDLEAVIRELELFDPRVPTPTEPTNLPTAVGDRFRALDQQIQAATEGAVDLSSAVFAFLVAASSYQALQGRFFPSAVSLLNYASKHLEADGDGKVGADPEVVE